MEQKKDILFRNQLALASLFFFRPLTKWIIKKDWFNLDSNDKSFIEWYIKIWLLASLLLLIYIAIVFGKYYIWESILDPISKILIIVILVIIISWVIWIFSNISIWEKINTNTTATSKNNILLTYFPLINIYSRYNNHDFDKPDTINKESIILRTIFTISLVTGNLFMIAIILIIIILRFVSLLMWIEVFGNKFKESVNKIFHINPEEIWWYVSWSIIYLFKKKDKQQEIQDLIENEKIDYQKLYNTKEIFHIKVQYILLIVLLWTMIYFNTWNISFIIFVWIILSRYAIMQIKWKHLPSIPLIKELVFIIIKITNKFTSTK